MGLLSHTKYETKPLLKLELPVAVDQKFEIPAFDNLPPEQPLWKDVATRFTWKHRISAW